MKTIIITGSSRGIGYGLADAFLLRNCRVVVSGSTQASTDTAVEKLTAVHGAADLLGIPCDVRDPAQVQALWDSAAAHYGTIDIWINNAGLSGPMEKLAEVSGDAVQRVIGTNIEGTLHGARVAIAGMTDQGHGFVYNMEGMGSNGRTQEGMNLYGSTKYAVRYINKVLEKETADTPVKVGAIQPGMVITDLVLDHYRGKPEELDRVKGIFNIIADRVENVTPVLADAILANEKHGALIAYTPRWKLMLRFLTAPFNRRDVFKDIEL